VKFDIGGFHENPSSSSKFGNNRTKASGTLHEDPKCISHCCQRRMWGKNTENALLCFTATL